MTDSNPSMPCDDWFTRDEFVDRIARVRHEMGTRGIDILLITTEHNFTYFSGVQTPSFISKTRPLVFVLPILGDASIVVAKSHVKQSAVCSWVDDVRGFDGFEPDSIEVVAQTLKDAGARGARIGCELGDEQRLGITYLGFEALRRRLPESEFIDASATLWAVRSVKSPTELAYHAEVGRITGASFDAAIAAARPGVPERSLHQAFATTAAGLGATRPGYLSMHSGRGEDTRSNRWPGDRVLETGDIVWMDAGTTYRGYWSDYTRMVSLGKPTTKQADAYLFVYDVSRAVLESVRPGVTCDDLMDVCRRRFAAAGREIGNATRIGHGVGLELTEPPSIVGGDSTPLALGMVLAIEPGLRLDYGYFVVEENFVVTESGFELLSVPAPEKLPSIS